MRVACPSNLVAANVVECITNETSQVKGQNEISSCLPDILRNVYEFKTNLPSNINIPFLETMMAEVTV